MARTVTFTFRHTDATSVALAGDFNQWDTAAHPMTYDSGLGAWTARLKLASGHYEYKFFVDGRDWYNDPEARKVPNDWGSENSYIDVP